MPRYWTDRAVLAAIALDGKTLRGSFDRFQDQKALQVLSALATDRTLVLGHVLISAADKSHEIPAAQQLIDELDLSGRLFTLDALHCQKNGRVRHRHSQPPARASESQSAYPIRTSDRDVSCPTAPGSASQPRDRSP